jgi:hypothetical protein
MQLRLPACIRPGGASPAKVCDPRNRDHLATIRARGRKKQAGSLFYNAPSGQLRDVPRPSGAQCSIGFQPVSGRAARHPRKSVIHGTGTIWHTIRPRGRKKQAGCLFYNTPSGQLRDVPRPSGAQCSIGFQPVSGRAARHPRKSVIHGTGTIWQPSAHVDEKTGWKPILQSARLRGPHRGKPSFPLTTDNSPAPHVAGTFTIKCPFSLFVVSAGKSRLAGPAVTLPPGSNVDP